MTWSPWSPRAEGRSTLAEIRVTDQVAVQERGLVDHSSARAHRGQRLGQGLGGVFEGTGDFDDFARAGCRRFNSARYEASNSRPLPELRLLVGLGLLRPKRRVVRRRPVERAQVLALVEIHEVGGGEEQAGVAALHSSPYER